MESRAMCSSNQDNLEKVERDLWNALLQAEGIHCDWTPDQPLTEEMLTAAELPHAKIAYPWNPAEPDAEAFFNQAESDSIVHGWSSEEITTRAETFFAQLDTLLAAASTATVETALMQRFAACVPQQLLSTIATQAQRLTQSSLSLADQLVQCVHDLLPSLPELVEEDLYVLARPLAFAMRDPQSQTLDSTLETVHSMRWQELSQTEQARLSLAIARYALGQSERADEE